MFYTARACARTHTHRSPPYAATSGDTSDEHLKRLERPTRQTVRLRLRANSPSHGGSAVGRRTPPRPRCTARTGSLYTHYTLQRRIRAAGPPRVPASAPGTVAPHLSRALPVFHSDPMFPRALAAHIRFHGNTPPRIRALRDGAPPSDTHHTSDSPPTTRRRLYVTHTHTHITITQTQARYEDNTSHGCHPFRFRRRSTRIHAILDAPRSLPGPPKMLKRNTTSMTIYASRE